MSKAHLQMLEIVWLDPQELIPWRNNAKEHPPEQVDAIAQQINTYGWDQPAVIAPNKVILKGHGRQLAAIKLKCKIPCVYKYDLTEADQVAIRNADNKVAESRWNTDNLKVDFEYLQSENYDMSLTGFRESEITLIMTDWETDIEAVAKVRPVLDGIEAVIKVRCPQPAKDELVRVIKEAVHNAGISGTTIT